MTTAIIIAGGCGSRTGAAVPKQFLTVHDIPIIAYTMMNVQRVASIDHFIVVCPNGWESFVSTYAAHFNVSKFQAVVTGGDTRNESIYNGLCYLNAVSKIGKVCLVDANRPLIPVSVFNEVISLSEINDYSLAAEVCHDSMFISYNGKTISENVNRDILYKGTTPECATIETFMELYSDTAILKDANLSTAGIAMLKGKKIAIAKGNMYCFKITTVDDFELFKALLNTQPFFKTIDT